VTQQPPASESFGVEDLFALGRELSNWGRWGDDDQKGALNFIGPAERVRAAAAVRSGRTFSLSLPLKNGVGPQNGSFGRNNCVHVMTQTGDAPGPLRLGLDVDFTDDMLIIACQGSTQWDALSHLYYGGQMYNGVPAAEVNVHGAGRNGIEHVHADLVGRGVLLDVARHQGVECCDPQQPIHAAELDACAASQGVEITRGDIVLVRTGVMTRVVGDDWSPYFATRQPGIHLDTARWLAEHEIAAVASDSAAVEGRSPIRGVPLPLHMVALRDMGVHLGEIWYLEELAADCAADGRYDCFLAAQALQIVGGCGSPVNPIAVK
jgi:kynurenine formamidase